MGRISPYIKEGSKVSILGNVVSESISRPILGDMWKTKRLFATVLQVAPGNNRWKIRLDASPDVEVEVSAGRMKFVAVSNDNSNERNEVPGGPEESNELETDFSSEEEEETEETVTNNGEIMWATEIVTVDSRQVNHTYSKAPVVHISDIVSASPRQFFERFLPVEYIMSTVIPCTNKHARESERTWNNISWMEFMRFIGILTIMTYVHCADIRDYWSVKEGACGVALSFGKYMSHKRFRDITKYLILSDTNKNDDPFFFARKFHDAFNENLSKAITPGDHLCIDESICQWMGKVDKGPFQQKIPRKPHPIGCEFKTIADA